MSKFFAYIRWLGAFLAICQISPVNAQPAPLTVGILPTLSPRVLINNYQPFRIYLEQTLKRPVELVTATDFTSFHKSTMAGHYDIVVTAANLARLAQVDAGYLPMATYKSTNRALLITSKANPLKTTRELLGQTVATLDRFALIAGQARVWLQEQGLHERLDYQLLEASSHNSAGYSVLSGESTLAIISPAGWKQMPQTLQQGLQVYATLPPVPRIMWLASPHLLREVPQLKSVLLAFSPSIPEGKQFFEVTGYQGMRQILPAEMKSLDLYTVYIKKYLGQ